MGAVNIEIAPVTAQRWDDLERLFGPSGAYSGCWCMWNRQTNKEFEEKSGDTNRGLLKDIVTEAAVPPGLIAYVDGEPAGWVAVAPREEYGRLGRSPVTKPVDDLPVWSITCFVIGKAFRGRGVGTALLAAAVEFAGDHGATAVEGYPVEPRKERMPDIYAWMGLSSMFEAAGFDEIARRSEQRPFMRRMLD